MRFYLSSSITMKINTQEVRVAALSAVLSVLSFFLKCCGTQGTRVLCSTLQDANETTISDRNDTLPLIHEY
jgi:hypothetical protein